MKRRITTHNRELTSSPRGPCGGKPGRQKEVHADTIIPGSTQAFGRPYENPQSNLDRLGTYELLLRDKPDTNPQTLQEAAASLYELARRNQVENRAQFDFLLNMSHELRTPLNAVIGFTELVLNRGVGDLNPTQEEYLGYVVQSSQQLLSLINDILDLARVEADRLELEYKEVDLEFLLEKSLKLCKENALKHGIHLSGRIEGIPKIIKADERKLKQIVYNVLSNAIRSTPDGGSVCLSARLISDPTPHAGLHKGGEQPFIEISVSDTGVGILPEDLERIFNPFQQIGNSERREYQGAGLGLPLSRKLVELHGGQIWGESLGLGKGSTFTFTIPA